MSEYFEYCEYEKDEEYTCEFGYLEDENNEDNSEESEDFDENSDPVDCDDENLESDEDWELDDENDEDEQEEPEHDEYDWEFIASLTFDETDENESDEPEPRIYRHSQTKNRIDNTHKAYPLEEAVRQFCQYVKTKYGIPFDDLTNVRNFIKHKGERIVDFVIKDQAAIEAKNWNCNKKKKYRISVKNAKDEITIRFKNYPQPNKVLIISDPLWYEGSKEHLLNEGIHLIELGFFVRNNEKDISKAYEIIKNKMLTILSSLKPLGINW